MTLDRVPGDDELYIGGIFTLRRGQALADEGVTHVVSALNLQVDERLFEHCKKRVVFSLDDEDQEDILQYFTQSNDFIAESLKEGGKVLVHCAMGKSRSATLVIAYLMRTRGLGVEEALSLVRTARPFAEPNDGFMEQLKLYERMGSPEDVGANPIYQRWLFQRELARSREVRQAPESIRFEDEVKRAPAETEEAVALEAKEYRCRKCRRSLATSAYVTHAKPKDKPEVCSHIFIEPLSWMRPELEQGKLDGRLECPNERCRQSVGKYAWVGNKCTCNTWIVPGISLHRSKIDEVKARSGVSLGATQAAGETLKTSVQGKM